MTRPALPPLNAVKAFEVAARHGSFQRAAGELGVTAAAVSQQVRLLEDRLGRRLFDRQPRGLALTDAGATLYPAVARGLDTVADGAAQVAQHAVGRRLKLSAVPSVAARWLPGVLARFLAIHPQHRIDLQIADDPVEFARDDIDLRLCYGAHLYPDLAVTPLIVDAVLPVCAPALRDRLPPADPLRALDDRLLIHTDWGRAFASHPSWSDWLRAAGIDGRVDPSLGHRVAASAAALDLAAAGAGVALGQRMLAADDLAAGRLVRLVDGPALRLRHAYCLVTAHAKTGAGPVRALTVWLCRTAASCDAD